MATRRTTFDKLQRERAKKAKAAAKRDRRLEGRDDVAEDGEELVIEAPPAEDPASVLAQIERIHEQFAAKELAYEDFEKQKVALFARLTID